MNLLFIHSHKFIKSGEKYYTPGQLPYEVFATRYLQNFENVTVCARVLEKNFTKKMNRSDGKNVIVKKLPNLSVIKKRKTNIKLTNEILTNEIKKADFIIARMPSGYSNTAIKIAQQQNKPLIVEVVGDVFESLWNHGSVLGKILAPIRALQHKKSIKKSKYTIYVTEKNLQEKYPSMKNACTINASNVEVSRTSESVLHKRIEKEKERYQNNIKIGLIGSFATKYKGIHNGIDLIAFLIEKGITAELHVLGSGENIWLKERAEKLGVLKNVHFHGLLPTGEPVLEWLDELDLYIQPSLTEGLPRALIEAMSRGIPAIGSNVGGIPELLEPNLLHEPNNSKDLVDKVLSLINNQTKMLKQAERNFNKAQEYSVEVLRERRNAFWEKVLKKEQLK